MYGIKVGKPNYEKNSQLKTQEQLASDLGMDVRTLQNYKLLAEMIPELEELLDTGVVTKRRVLSFTYTIIKKKHVQIIKHRIKIPPVIVPEGFLFY